MTPSQHPPEERRPIGALLAPDILSLLEEAPSQIAAETEEMHPADLADVAEAMPFDRVPVFLAALPKERAADVLEYLDEELRAEVLEAMTAEQAAALVTEMNPDERADVLEELDEERAEEIVEEMPAAARKETEELRRFDPDSAGGLMTTEFVSVEATTSVEEALRRVRVIARSEKREAMHAVYTTDDTGKLAGVLSLRELLAAPEGATLADVAWTEPITVSPNADREEVARVISNYDLVVVPVVSESGHLMGVITVDDVIDAIQEEQTEDVQKFGGMQALDEPYMQIGILGDDEEARRLAEHPAHRRDAHDGRSMQGFDEELAAVARAHAVRSPRRELGRQLRVAGDVADHARDGASRGDAARLVACRAARAAVGTDARPDPRRHRHRCGSRLGSYDGLVRLRRRRDTRGSRSR